MLDISNEQWLKKRIRRISVLNKYIVLIGMLILLAVSLFIFYSIRILIIAWNEIHLFMNQPSDRDISSGIVNLLAIGVGGFIISLISVFGILALIYISFLNEKKYINMITQK